MVDSLTNEQFLEWQAVAVIDGWFNGWTHTAEILAAIRDSANRQILSHVPKERHRQAFDSMDWRSGYKIAELMTDFSKKKKRNGNSIEQAQMYLEANFGGKK